MSNPTIKRKIDILKKKNLYSGTYAVYEPRVLELQRIIVLFKIIKTSDFTIIEKVLDHHPYTVHRSRIYSPYLGIYAQFYFPESDFSLLKSFVEKMKELELVSDYDFYLSTSIERNLSADLQKISFDKLHWKFDWTKFRKKYEDTESKTYSAKSISVLSEVKPLDFKILNILTKNAEVSQQEIIEILGFTRKKRTSVWRSYHFLEEKVLSGFKAKINRKIFNLTSNRIILLDFNSKNDLYKFFTIFEDEELRPPFRYFLEIIQDENQHELILLYISFPQYHESQLFYFLQDIANVVSYNIDTVGNNAVRYAFYPGNYDFEKKCWKLNEQYVVFDPLNDFL